MRKIAALHKGCTEEENYSKGPYLPEALCHMLSLMGNPASVICKHNASPHEVCDKNLTTQRLRVFFCVYVLLAEFHTFCALRLCALTSFVPLHKTNYVFVYLR